MCCTMRSMATWLSPPRGIITSAYFFVGSTKSSNDGFTNLAYCNNFQGCHTCQTPKYPFIFLITNSLNTFVRWFNVKIYTTNTSIYYYRIKCSRNAYIHYAVKSTIFSEKTNSKSFVNVTCSRTLFTSLPLCTVSRLILLASLTSASALYMDYNHNYIL